MEPGINLSWTGKGLNAQQAPAFRMEMKLDVLMIDLPFKYDGKPVIEGDT